jgi:chromosome segregation ATPase
MLKLALYLVGAGFAGIAVGYLTAFWDAKRRADRYERESRKHIEDLSRQRDLLNRRYSKIRLQAEALHHDTARARTERHTAVAQATKLARIVQAMRNEREATKLRVGKLQASLVSVHRQSQSLQREIDRANAHYLQELREAREKERHLEHEVKLARREQIAFQERVEKSSLEHGSEEEMVVAAQLRLGQIEVLERNLEKREQEIEKLREEIKQLKQDKADYEQELTKLEELRINNEQLVRCVESLENRRAQHESEAERFREKADQSEQLSDTLRIRLRDLEASFAEIEQDQQQAIDQVRQVGAANETPQPQVANGTRR